MSGRLALDTNTYSALDKGNPVAVTAVSNAHIIGIPIIVLGELYFGFENGNKRERNITDLNRFMALNDFEILHINERTARIFGEISAELAAIGRPIQQNDIWIASLCKQHAYTLITGDGGFKYIKGLDIISF
ncbi:MAG: type II toxin-antitoxin system VapC family toxin [Candidatus Saccharimonadales bacterium]